MERGGKRVKNLADIIEVQAAEVLKLEVCASEAEEAAANQKKELKGVVDEKSELLLYT